MRKLRILLSCFLALGCSRNELSGIERNFSRKNKGKERMILYNNGRFIEVSRECTEDAILSFDWGKILTQAGKPNFINIHSHHLGRNEIDYNELTAEQIANVNSLDKETLENRLFVWIPSGEDIRWHFKLQRYWWKKNPDARIKSRIITMTQPRRIVEYGMTPGLEEAYKKLALAREDTDLEVDGSAGIICIRYLDARQAYLDRCLKPEDGRKQGKEPSVEEFSRIAEREGLYLKDLGFVKP